MTEPASLDCETASVAAAMSEPTYDSKRSAPMPAKPMTALVAKATERPSFREPFLPVFLLPAAAAVVLALPSVATIMPHQPAPAERDAPNTKDSEMASATVVESVA